MMAAVVMGSTTPLGDLLPDINFGTVHQFTDFEGAEIQAYFGAASDGPLFAAPVILPPQLAIAVFRNHGFERRREYTRRTCRMKRVHYCEILRALK
jgi:hypothetical protein